MSEFFHVDAYTGSRRKIVLAFDVGTTFSGISYSILDPGQRSGINAVTRFPAHETISGASKIPTVIYYDKNGSVMAVGAEASKEGIQEAALEGNWYEAEWFKLHLRSKFGDGKTLHPSIPPLPPKKTVVDVLADFLRYLLTCAAQYIQGIGCLTPSLNSPNPTHSIPLLPFPLTTTTTAEDYPSPNSLTSPLER